ncbi:hypothetical protein [Aliikangiella sp. IMCC44359]|uniref:hypothetical protein n=1 Tax=Aliikangiella sp. IMCC44359 TaxID=3459125 RepID=UPI00403AD7BE
MINNSELKKKLTSRFPDWNLSFQESGVAIWIDFNDGNLFFDIQVTPSDGIGVSVVNNDYDIDMSGHDEVFENIDEVVNYLEERVKNIK